MQHISRLVAGAVLASVIASSGCASNRTLLESDPRYPASQGSALCDSLEIGTTVDIKLKSDTNVEGKMTEVTAQQVTVGRVSRGRYKEVVVDRADIAAMSVTRWPSDGDVTSLTVVGLLAGFVAIIVVGSLVSMSGSLN